MIASTSRALLGHVGELAPHPDPGAIERRVVEERRVVREGMPGLAAVAGSAGSMPVIAPSITAASVTLRVIGPAVSCSAEIGMIPARLSRPTVGLMPTTAFAPAGQTIEPSVSVPTVIVARLADTATAEPELDPHGLRSRT